MSGNELLLPGVMPTGEKAQVDEKEQVDGEDQAGGEDHADAPPATRIAAVVVPAWPLLAAREKLAREKVARAGSGAGAAAGAPAEGASAPVVVMDRHRVSHADAAALAVGVGIGMRRRAAQAACPEAVVVEADVEHESALFELVAAAVDTVAAGVDVLRPGVLLMSARGPARHRGGEDALAEAIVDAVAELTGWDAVVGIADGPFAALLAARSGRIVRPGRSRDYLGPHAISALRDAPVGPGWGHRDQPAADADRTRRVDLAEVIDLLERLGIRTLGDFADLPATSVAARFGPDVAQLHLLARGGEPTPPQAHHPTQPLEVARTLDPPLVRVDQAAFAARPMAEELHGMLVARGLICTRLRILALTASGEEMERTWRHDGALSPADVVDRIRWQCDGWITRARLRGEQTGQITRLALQPVQLLPAGEGAPALWGSAGEAAQRAGRAFARAQGLAGEEAVLVPVEVGGRLLAEQVALVPWRSERPTARPGPWPGSLPRPLPSVVLRTPPLVVLRDAEGAEVVVTARALLSAPPAVLEVPRAGSAGADGIEALVSHGVAAGRAHRVLAHGAPTVLDERWWRPDGRRAARLAVVIEPGRALVLLSREGAWTVEGIHD
ncbi:DNA polymerase Y family protein [Brachybacterium halotolerans subsp. kimchii]|uniref:DNA polymerase Y family protein n=1 Tax=Brachybacterium halotolerans TaxID=2795215 RepID=UPI001E4B696F|nr:DNA polymerase Y family protein [Brachybacterium halotolerans]UEJ83204.1 DNA polymerase Y family protein [Brachybacterium halotolerans subsp. kimchii]